MSEANFLEKAFMLAGRALWVWMALKLWFMHICP